MGRFRSSQSQARHAIKQRLALGRPSHGEGRKDGKVHSLGTARTYKDSLAGLTTFIAKHRLDPSGHGLSGLTYEVSKTYLNYRSEEVGQKQLDKDRQAIQMLLGISLPVFKSEFDQALQCRAYTTKQIHLISGAQSRKHYLATLIAADAGLRAHELLTLLPASERAPSAHRIWTEERFEGREDLVFYTVTGKGGLIRVVGLDIKLAEQLEKLRLSVPRNVTDREIYYVQNYDVGGGKQWSDSFSRAAQRELGWSAGAHGLRHTYAQKRMRALQSLGHLYERALSIVSQEMGHFRPEITEVYLR